MASYFLEKFKAKQVDKYIIEVTDDAGNIMSLVYILLPGDTMSINNTPTILL